MYIIIIVIKARRSYDVDRRGGGFAERLRHLRQGSNGWALEFRSGTNLPPPLPSPFLPPSFFLRLSFREVDSMSVPSDKTKNRDPLCYIRAHAEGYMVLDWVAFSRLKSSGVWTFT